MTFLARSDVERITKRVRYSAQRRQLDAMGIKYRQAADGEPLVPLDALDAKAKPARNSGPRWNLLNIG